MVLSQQGTLFRSLLAADGIESYPILINLTRHLTVSEEIPNLQAFNHFVVGVAVSGDVPPAFAPAVVQAGELGALLIVDTTDEYITPGYLSASLSGKTGLVAIDTMQQINSYLLNRHYDGLMKSGKNRKAVA